MSRRRRLRLDAQIDVGLTLRTGRPLAGSGSLRIRGDEALRATRTPEGPATTHVRQLDGRVEAESWGPGAAWALENLPGLIGLEDRTADGFEPREEPLRSLHLRYLGLRVPRTRAVFEAILPVVLAQKVPGKEAGRSYRRLVERYGEPAPGPFDEGSPPGPGRLVLPPPPELLAGLGYERFHPLGVEKRRADTVRRVAACARRLEEITGMRREQAFSRLTAVPGVGPWTAAKVLFAAWGDPDAVALGDYNLPHLVAWNLKGEPRGDDERMLELLDPYRGHRGRVVQLLELGGHRAPRRGPRLEMRRIERY